MKSSRVLYLSYLLRLYGKEQDGKVVWGASLENPMSGERVGFSSVDALLNFIQDQCQGVESGEKPFSSYEQ